jgi:hypothetical protein
MDDVETIRAGLLAIANEYAEDADTLFALAERLWEWVVEPQQGGIVFIREPGRA